MQMHLLVKQVILQLLIKRKNLILGSFPILKGVFSCFNTTDEILISKDYLENEIDFVVLETLLEISL